MGADYITKSTCDCCMKPNLKGVMFHHMGSPVYFGCRKCHPTNYRSALKREGKPPVRRGIKV